MSHARDLDAIVVNVAADLQRPVTALRAGQVGTQLVDRDLEVLDIVDREAEPRRETGNDEADYFQIFG
jgi:hypothetical protein